MRKKGGVCPGAPRLTNSNQIRRQHQKVKWPQLEAVEEVGGMLTNHGSLVWSYQTIFSGSCAAVTVHEHTECVWLTVVVSAYAL